MFVSKGSYGYGEPKNVFPTRSKNRTYQYGAANYPVSVVLYRAENGNFRKFLYTYRQGIPRFHQRNFYIKRKLRVWRIKKCIPLVGANTVLTCTGLETTPFHAQQYRAYNGNLRKFGSTYRHDTAFAPM